MPLTDAQAKACLIAWPRITGIWTRSDDTTRWLQAQPPVVGSTGPRLALPGAGAFRTQPDGLWVTLGVRPSDTTTTATFADCVAVESCGSPPNFNDKRSRYAARTTSLVLELPSAWLDATVTVQSGTLRQRRDILRGQLPATGREPPVAAPTCPLRTPRRRWLALPIQTSDRCDGPRRARVCVSAECAWVVQGTAPAEVPEADESGADPLSVRARSRTGLHGDRVIWRDGQ
jgi:hypothetical protein